MAWPEWSLRRILAERPRVRVNQVGYLPAGPKSATLVSDATAPLSFTVVDAAGEAIFTGATKVWPERPDPTSGLSVHVLDFSALRVVAFGLSIRCGTESSHPFQIGPTAYAGLAENALRFFLVQRSGRRDRRGRGSRLRTSGGPRRRATQHRRRGRSGLARPGRRTALSGLGTGGDVRRIRRLVRRRRLRQVRH